VVATRTVRVGDIAIGSGHPLVLIAGPCALESESLALEVAAEAKAVADRLGLPFVFKSSYLKDNRLSHGSYAGPGLETGLPILDRVRREVGVPVLSDVHAVDEVGPAAEVLDVIQIPAFLCRQTRLLTAAARTGRPVNIKKGQFMAPEDMARVAGKAEAVGNDRILLTERGVAFGYRNLVVDMAAIGVMRSAGYPVVFDATHSVQRPGSADGVTGGRPEFVPLLARSACAAGCDALFVETHPDPPSALSDAGSMIPLADLETTVASARDVAAVVRRS